MIDINFSNVLSLFTTVSTNEIRRPVGMIDLLIGLDYCNLLPDKVEEGGNLQLMKGPLGYCLRGSHPLITSYDQNSASVNVLVHHTTLTTNDLQVNDVRLLNDEIKKYFTIESLGISSNRKCKKMSTYI